MTQPDKSDIERGGGRFQYSDDPSDLASHPVCTTERHAGWGLPSVLVATLDEITSDGVERSRFGICQACAEAHRESLFDDE